MKKIACFDIDGTLFRGGLYREVVYELLAAGHIPAEFKENYQHLEERWKNRVDESSYKEFEQAMANNFDKIIPRVPCAAFDKAAQKVVAQFQEYVYRYTRDQAACLKKKGYTLIAISGSQEEVVIPFTKYYGFDIVVAQHYTRGEDGFFTGEIIKTHKGKDVILQDILASRPDLTLEDSYAFGDTDGDIGMLNLVDNPVAFNPNKNLFNMAKQEKWRVVVERKNMIYELTPGKKTFLLA